MAISTTVLSASQRMVEDSLIDVYANLMRSYKAKLLSKKDFLRLTEPSNGKVYCLREVILKSKKLGRPLTDEEFEKFRIKDNEEQ